MIRAREDRWFDRFRRTGDPRVLARVFDRTAPELWKVAAHLCRDRHAAEDAVQGTFLVAIESQGDWDAARPLLPWLLGLLVNRARDLQRRQRRQPELARVAPPAGERDPAELAWHDEFDAVFRAALQRVADPYRAVLERHLVHGLAAHEIAAETGVPAGTVRMRLHRGLDQLRKRLPAGFAGGAALLVLTPEAFASMRRVVLMSVPGGAELAAVSAGHFSLGWLGVILMKKIVVGVVAGLVLAGSWLWWQQSAGVPAPPVAPVVSTTMRPIAAETLPSDAEPAAATGNERREVAVATPKVARGQLRIVVQQEGSPRPINGFLLEVLAGLPDSTPRDGPLPPGFAAQAQHGEQGRTDAGGVATFALPPGVAQVQTSPPGDAGPWFVEIRPGQETELTIALPVKTTADVHVVDDQGRNIAGARVLGRTFGDVGEVVERELGRTGADGHWREQFVEKGVPIRAVHDGYVASRAADLRGNNASVQLVLAANPATVVGTVFGLDGRPLARAQVAIQPRAAGHAGERPLALVADEAGRFASAHVPPGAITVLAMAPVGVAERRCGRSDAVVVAGRTSTLEVRFLAGARIVATLRGGDGKPVVDQYVAAVLQPEPGLWVYFASYGTAEAPTDRDGVAQLAGLLPGEYEVQAFTSAGAKRATLQLVDGQEARVDWTLGATAWIEVQLVDDNDHPLGGWRVWLQPEVGTQHEARSGADGVVRFDDVAEQPYQLQVLAAGSWFASLRTAAPLRTRTVLRVPTTGLPTSSLHGSVRVGVGLDAATITAELVRQEQGRAEASPRLSLDPALAFRFDALPAGTYLLGFRRGEREYLGAPQQFIVAAGASVDTGAIALDAPVDVHVAVTTADGGMVARPFVGAALPERPRLFGLLPQTDATGGITLRNVPWGKYELLVWGETIAPQFVPVVVSAASTQVPVVAVRGTPTRFTWQARGSGLVTLRRDGAELLQVGLNSNQPTLGLLPGSYSIEVQANGKRGAAEFVVGAAAGAPVEVQLAK